MALFKKLDFPGRPAGPDEVVLDIHDIHAVSLDLVDQFDAFCKKHGLKYYLCGGTLLGAVRHSGFIPWDDDIDLFMSRPEYDRLVKICETEEIAPNVQFACLENKRFPRPFARLYNLRTEVQRKYYHAISGPHAWIDILPVDGLPDSPAKNKWLYRFRAPLATLNFNAMWKAGYASRKLLVLKRWRYHWLAKAVGPWGWARMLDRMGRSHPFEKSSTVGCFTAGRYGPGEAMPREAFEKSAKVTFEGREFETMSCWREYLTGIYGDFMKLPPEKDRIPHLDYVTMPRADHLALMERYPNLKAK